MKILVIGTGVMSNYVLDSIKSSGNICIGRYDKFGNGDFSDFNEINEEFDVIVDFSHHSLTKELLEFAIKKNKNILIATTGHSEEENEIIKNMSEKIAILKATNTSFGVNALNKIVAYATKILKDFDIDHLVKLKNICLPSSNNRKEYIFYQIESYLKNDIVKNNKKLEEKINDIIEEKNKKIELNRPYLNGDIKLDLMRELYPELCNILEKTTLKETKSYQNIDSPKFFDFSELIDKGLDQAIESIDENKNRYKEYVSSLKLRLASFMSDMRKAEPLIFNKDSLYSYENINNYLEIFFKYIFGDKDMIKGNLFFQYKEKTLKKLDKKNQIIILDLSLLPFELLETITGLIGRLILEFTQRINKVEKYKDKRGEYPIALILEEAQNYIPEVDKNGKKSITKKVFERIAREGRKFGVSLIVSSQRPSELSKTILSQCNTFIVHKLQNPEDQRYIRQIVSSANEELLNQLPILPQQHAIIMGEAVRTPSQVKINDITKKPDSNNPKFIEQWLKEKSEIEIEDVTDKWLDIDEKDKNNEENRENE